MTSPTTWSVLLIAAGIAAVLARRWWRRNTFSVRIENGAVTHVRGTPPGGFVRDVDRMCRLWKIDRGTVRVRWSGRRWLVRCGGGAGRHRQAFQGAIDQPL